MRSFFVWFLLLTLKTKSEEPIFPVKTLKVDVSTFEPFVSIVNGKPEGFDIDLIETIGLNNMCLWSVLNQEGTNIEGTQDSKNYRDNLGDLIAYGCQIDIDRMIALLNAAFVTPDKKSVAILKGILGLSSVGNGKGDDFY